MDWARRLRWLTNAGYDGFVGLEYMPTRSTEASLHALFREANRL
jgi:hydroxypyruvate isomerase